MTFEFFFFFFPPLSDLNDFYSIIIMILLIFIIIITVQFIRAGKFPESSELGKIRSFIDKSLNKMKKKENFWSF